MKIFKEFSYQLLRTFAITTLITAALLLYMAYMATRGNTYFAVVGVLFLVITGYFAYLSWQNYKFPAVSLSGKGEVYGGLCPNCGEMVKVGEKHCHNCGETIK